MYDSAVTEQPPLAAGWQWSVPALLVASAGGLLAGYVDTHVVPPHDWLSMEAITCVVAVAAIAGSICPRLAWLSALLVGLALPFAHLAITDFSVSVPRYVPFRMSDFRALIVSAVGAAGGAGGRIFLGRPIPRDLR